MWVVDRSAVQTPLAGLTWPYAASSTTKAKICVFCAYFSSLFPPFPLRLRGVIDQGSSQHDLHHPPPRAPGLTAEDVHNLVLAWRNTTAQVLRAVHGAGGWAWQMFTEAGPPEPTANVDSCIEQYVGFMLGLAVRFADGFMVGFVVGFAVGWPVGLAVGFAVGNAVGTWVRLLSR